MDSVTSFTLRFYLPLLVSSFLVMLVIFSPKFVSGDSPIELKGEVAVLGIKIPLPIWVKRVWIIRSLLLLAAFVSFLYAVKLDFSQFFPQRFRMDVYFDYKGIQRSLRVFSQEELADLSISSDWSNHVATYDDAVKNSLAALWQQRGLNGMPAITNITRDHLHAGGETTFIVQKVKFGLTSYRIMENNGHLDYEVDVANAPKQGWRGMFELCESPNNHIRPSIWKLLRSPAIMMRPEFKQIFSSDEGRYNTPFNHVVRLPRKNGYELR